MPGDFGEPVGLHKQIYTQTRPEHFFINIFTLVALLVEFPLFAFSRVFHDDENKSRYSFDSFFPVRRANDWDLMPV